MSRPSFEPATSIISVVEIASLNNVELCLYSSGALGDVIRQWYVPSVVAVGVSLLFPYRLPMKNLSFLTATSTGLLLPCCRLPPPPPLLRP